MFGNFRCWGRVLPMIALVSGSGLASAESWRVVPSIGLESTLTNNVNLSPNRISDWVNQLTPGVRFNETSAHTQLNGAIAVPVLLYARTSENNRVVPEANIAGTLEAIDKFLFVDANASVSQQFQTPFGARSASLANATQNRYTAQSYSLSPYIKGNMPGSLSYQLRDTNTWSDANASSIGSGRSYVNEINGFVTRAPTPLGWTFEYDRSDLQFSDQQSQITEIGRLRGLDRIDPTVELSVSIGYEDNRFFLTEERGTTYGAGVRWRPSDRTTVRANWEHRFFGSAYDVAVDHSTRLTVWSLSASRNISSYPQQLATLPQGGNVDALLNALYATRIVDPIQRQTLVDQLIRDRGLPPVLPGAVPLLAQQNTLFETATATLGLLGARNSIFFNAFRSRSEPVEDLQGGTFALLGSDININNTQIGANAIWTHQLTASLTLATNIGWSRATDNTNAGAATRLYSLQTYLSTPLSAMTSVYGGARYQNSRSNQSESFHEAAVFVGLTHTFH